MMMPKANRVAIYSTFFKQGALVVKKDPMLRKHPEIDVPNLHVMQVMKSLLSRGHVRVTFSWQHYYYFPTDQGLTYLRTFLNLPEAIKPDTHIEKRKVPLPSPRPHHGAGRYPSRRQGDSKYKSTNAPGSFRPTYRPGMNGAAGPAGPVRARPAYRARMATPGVNRTSDDTHVPSSSGSAARPSHSNRANVGHSFGRGAALRKQ